MKSKLLIVSLIAVLLFSALNVAPALADECPTCHGTGKVVCSNCQGTGKIAEGELGTCPTCQGSGELTPTISNRGTQAWAVDGAVLVTGKFQNEEDVAISGTVTAEIDASATTYTNTSESIDFPPHETIGVTVTIGEISESDYRYFSSQRYLRARTFVSGLDSTTCPDCDGTGVVSEAADCPYCDGTGFVTCPTCGGSLAVGGGQKTGGTDLLVVGGAVAGVAVAAALAIAAVLMVKRRRVSEESLRKLSPSEFQDWVVQRLSGRVSSQKDSLMGIDGYTVEGYPIQVKQSDEIGRNVIDNFATAMGRSKARSGIIVAFSFGRGAYEGVARAKLYYRLEIKTVTVKELIESRSRTL